MLKMCKTANIDLKDSAKVEAKAWKGKCDLTIQRDLTNEQT